MKKYPSYKPSGIECLPAGQAGIGEIPEHWEHGILKRFCNVTDGSHFSPKTQETGFPYISVKDIGINEIDLVNCKRISESDFEDLTKNGCQPSVGDILLTKDGTIGRAAVVTEDYEPFVVLSSLGILTPNPRIYSKFLYYYLISGINIDQMYSFIHGSALTRLTIEKIENLQVTSPPLPEQTAIASYLDRKTTEIDELIADKKRLLELYEEEKTAIINHAVTRGINPDVRMKDSQIEWLGEIPEHWMTTRINRVIKVKDGTHDTPSYLPRTKDNFPLITSKDFKNGDINFEDSKYISKEDHENIVKRSNTKKGDIIMSMIGGNIGNLVLVKTDRPFSIKNVCLFKTSHNEWIAKHLFYILKSGLLKYQIDINSRGGAQGFLSLDDLRSLVYFIVPENEIEAFVHHIETECSRIDTQMERTKKLINLLTEYRTSLISEVVTGKVKVT